MFFVSVNIFVKAFYCYPKNVRSVGKTCGFLQRAVTSILTKKWFLFNCCDFVASLNESNFLNDLHWVETAFYKLQPTAKVHLKNMEICTLKDFTKAGCICKNMKRNKPL